jgi:hypothetical protein
MVSRPQAIFGWLLLGSGITACAHEPDRRPPPAATVATTTATATAMASTRAPEVAAPVAITVHGPGTFEIANTAGHAVSLAVLAHIERKDSQSGAETEVTGLDLGRGYRLVERCDEAVGGAEAKCVALAAGASLWPVPWSGLSCSAQCNGSCRSNVWYGHGTFRLAIATCDGAAVRGPLYDLEGAEPTNGERLWAATALVSVSAARLDLPKAAWDATAPGSASTLAGFTVRAGTERALDAAAVADLAALLRDPKGYDDVIAKRCAMGKIVGFRAVHSLPTTGSPQSQIVEIGVDLVCSKIFVVREAGPGRPRVVHASHFDPSRPAFVALIRRIFPGEREL